MAGTYCSRLFTDCDRKACRLQSPNFPGVYPRNLTCYYAVRQHDVPEGKQALIAVRQPKGQLVAIRSQSALHGPSSQQQQQQQQLRSRQLKVWASDLQTEAAHPAQTLLSIHQAMRSYVAALAVTVITKQRVMHLMPGPIETQTEAHAPEDGISTWLGNVGNTLPPTN
jgi:hypothetical protein